MSVYSGDKLAWLQEACESVLAQTLPASVFFIVIDGDVATDIALYLSALERDNVSIILAHGANNKGLSTCMNYIIDWAIQYKPSYFFRMDADDISVSHRFEKQVQLLENHPDVDVLGSALWEIDESGKRVGIRRLPTKHSALLNSFSRRCPLNHPTVAIRFKVFENEHRYLVDKLNTQDYFFWIQLAKGGYKFANVREPLLHFRRINGFYKRRGRGKSLNEFKARMFAMEQLEQKSWNNYVYAVLILVMRMMPAQVIKVAYKVDRYFLNKIGRH
ncbi:glycosyltransferase [Shewanella benthica]|nr:glycosyltransferase [Shewanella benthica]